MFHSISRLNTDTNPTICTTKGSHSRSALFASLPNKTQHTKASIFSNCAINNRIRSIPLVKAVSRDHSPVDLVGEFKGPQELRGAVGRRKVPIRCAAAGKVRLCPGKSRSAAPRRSGLWEQRDPPVPHRWARKRQTRENKNWRHLRSLTD